MVFDMKLIVNYRKMARRIPRYRIARYSNSPEPISGSGYYSVPGMGVF